MTSSGGDDSTFRRGSVADRVCASDGDDTAIGGTEVTGPVVGGAEVTGPVVGAEVTSIGVGTAEVAGPVVGGAEVTGPVVGAEVASTVVGTAEVTGPAVGGAEATRTVVGGADATDTVGGGATGGVVGADATDTVGGGATGGVVGEDATARCPGESGTHDAIRSWDADRTAVLEDRHPTRTVGSEVPTPPGSRPLYRAEPDRILRILAESQFEDPFLAFRELYANALDAVGSRPEARILLEVSPTRVVVEDDGPGLDTSAVEALTTLGASTRRGTNAVGRFGIGFASIFDPALGVLRVVFRAGRPPGREDGIELRFVPDEAGGVAIEARPSRPPPLGGSRVEVLFDPSRAPPDRVARVSEVFETHAAYAGVETTLDGRRLGRSLVEFVDDELRAGRIAGPERKIVGATRVESAVGVAAIDPARSEARFRAYRRGLFVCELVVPRPEGRPWPRGVFGAVSAEGLELVASRNAFVEDHAFHRFLGELRRLAREAGCRLLRHYVATGDPYARVVLLDALRRGLRTTAPEVLVAEADEIFGSALVRAPLFEAWGEVERYPFERLVELDQEGRFRALSYRPSLEDRRRGPVLRAEDSVERDIFRKLSGLRDMPAAAREEAVARPGLLSRLQDRFLSGPRAEYSLFRREVTLDEVPPGAGDLVAAVERFLRGPEAHRALARFLPGPLPRLGFGASRNAFGPIAAYRTGEIRFNVRHRSFVRLARHPDPDRAARALLPVVAHELAHMCHDLHDLDFYRTSRTLLRALVVAAAAADAHSFEDETVLGVRLPAHSEPT